MHDPSAVVNLSGRAYVWFGKYSTGAVETLKWSVFVGIF